MNDLSSLIIICVFVFGNASCDRVLHSPDLKLHSPLTLVIAMGTTIEQFSSAKFHGRLHVEVIDDICLEILDFQITVSHEQIHLSPGALDDVANCKLVIVIRQFRDTDLRVVRQCRLFPPST